MPWTLRGGGGRGILCHPGLMQPAGNCETVDRARGLSELLIQKERMKVNL